MSGRFLHFGCATRLPIGAASELRVLILDAAFRYPREMPGQDWSNTENDLIVADYFAMLADDLLGRRYNKTEHRRRLAPLLSNRSDGSLEFKHQNISAVLKGIGEDWIPGYKPAFNFQTSLEDAVQRWLASHPTWLERPPASQKAHGQPEGLPLWIGPAPSHSNLPPRKELGEMFRIASKFDVASRDARNRILGRAGEEKILRHEQSVLKAAGRPDLADNVRWISEEEGDGAGYDIASFTPDGKPRFIEVKTTNGGWDRTPFYISRNELAVADLNRDRWSLLRVWNFSRDARAFELRPPLEAHVSLSALSFQAAFR